MYPTTPSDPDQLAGGRTFSCSGCGFPITLLEGDDPPACPRCGGEDFEPASMFSGDTVGLEGPAPAADPAWLLDLRGWLVGEGPHLAWESAEGIEVTPLEQGFTRVGRSLRADVRLHDATVSRRHALLHREADTTTVLDDHSLNGVFVNGMRVDWRPLDDGDELELGSFRLHFLAVPGARS